MSESLGHAEGLRSYHPYNIYPEAHTRHAQATAGTFFSMWLVRLIPSHSATEIAQCKQSIEVVLT
jgi:hypothetical protein